MAKKEKITAEELLTVFDKPVIKAKVEESIKKIKKPFAIVSLIEKDSGYQATYVCPKCGEVFLVELTSYSMWRSLSTGVNPVFCPECDYNTNRRLMQTEEEIKEYHKHVVYDDDDDFITVCDFSLTEKLCFCDSGEVSQKIERTPYAITRYNKKTNEKNSFIFDPETTVGKPTKTRPSNLFRMYSVAEDCIISTDSEKKTRQQVSDALYKMSRVETKE